VAAAVQLTEADVPRAAGVVARAFGADPLLVHMLPDAELRARLGPVHLAPVVRMCCRYGEGWRTQDWDAVAAWMPPGTWPPSPEWVERCGFAQAAAAVGDEAMARFHAVYGLTDGFQHQVPQPHWLLNIVATEPGRRGRGAASAALEPVLERASAERCPCYLETFEERNVGFYERLGFAVLCEARDAATGIRCWGMLRR
jgi:GNAT superfamily N-acetyltransferase